MTKRQNTHILETEKFIPSLRRHFLTKTLEILHKDLSYDGIFPHQIWFNSDEEEQS